MTRSNQFLQNLGEELGHDLTLAEALDWLQVGYDNLAKMYDDAIELGKRACDQAREAIEHAETALVQDKYHLIEEIN